MLLIFYKGKCNIRTGSSVFDGIVQQNGLKKAADELLSDALNKEETKEPKLVNATKITLSDQNIDVSGEGVKAADGEISIVKGGTYLITGTLSDGNVVVNAPDGTEKPNGMEPPDGAEGPENPEDMGSSEKTDQKTDQNTDNKQ